MGLINSIKSLFSKGSITENTISELRHLMEQDRDNVIINGTSLRATLETYLEAGEIEMARKMFACHRNEAMKAISEYNTSSHKILMREDKKRKGKEDFETSKLPRPYQRLTNQTGAFFMFGNKITLTLGNKPEESKQLEESFDEFKEFLKNMYFDENLYMARQITGAETECAKIYSLYKDEDGNVEVVCQLKSNGQGHVLYPLFNQYGKMVAFAVGYFMRNLEFDLEEHFDVYTKKNTWKFYRKMDGATDLWLLIEKLDNPFNKIPVIYYRHEVDWEGAQERIEKLEWRDSKHSDTVEYFGDPYLLLTADIAGELLSDAREVGRVMVMENSEGRMEYVTPPDNANMIKDEKDDLKTSIEQATLTPDWSYKSIMGLGTLSGEAMRRANLPGYVKRTQFAVGVYNELIRRELNLIKTILCDYVYLKDSKKADLTRKMKINFDYTDPFIGGIENNADEIATLVGSGSMSIHAAVASNRYIVDKQAEEERIWEEKKRAAEIEKQKITQNTTITE